MQNIGNSHSLDEEMQYSIQSLWKTVWEFPLISNIHSVYNLASLFLGIYPKEIKNICIHINLYGNIYISFYHNHQKLDTT